MSNHIVPGLFLMFAILSAVCAESTSTSRPSNTSTPIDKIALQDQLIRASKTGNQDRIRELLQLGILDVNWRRSNGEDKSCHDVLRNATALHYATDCNPSNVSDVIRLLLGNRADVNVKESFNGMTALLFSASNGQLDAVRLLLDRHAEIEAQSDGGDTALMRAALSGKSETVGLLLDQGANINAKNSYGWTALHYAANQGKLETVRLLLDRGADIAAKNNYGYTALMYAAKFARLDTLQLLLDRNGDINAKANNSGCTALIFATKLGYLDTIRLLLDRGADINAKDQYGYTALMWAAWNHQLQALRLLKGHGASLEGCTASFSPYCNL